MNSLLLVTQAQISIIVPHIERKKNEESIDIQKVVQENYSLPGTIFLLNCFLWFLKSAKNDEK